MIFPSLNNSELERISNILGATTSGFTGSEITRLLALCSIPDDASNSTKRIRLFNSFAKKCNLDQNCNCVYQFIKEALQPARWLDAPDAKETMRRSINEVLALKGIQITNQNQFEEVAIATTVPDAKRRASELGRKLYDMNAHYLVRNCCTEEFLANDYFHAVHEAAKSLTDRIAVETGMDLDGAKLIERAFSIDQPAVVLNTLRTLSEQNEHRGLKEMLLGIHFSVRNVTAHEMRMKWDIDEAAAINILSIISALHKMLDQCHFIRQS